MSELLEKILSNDNMNLAYKRVCANKGAGVDGVTVEELCEYIKENWGSNTAMTEIDAHLRTRIRIIIWK